MIDDFDGSRGNDCSEMAVTKMGSLSDFELLICMFLVLRCRYESSVIAARPFIIL